MTGADETLAGGGWGGVDLAAIWKASGDILQTQVKIVERAVVAGIERRLDVDHQRAAGREAHKLAGSLGTFGFHEGSRLARSLELALASPELLDPAEALGLSRQVMDLQVEMAKPPASTFEPVGADGPSLLVIDAKPDRARRLVEAAAGHGVRARPAATLDAARDLVDSGLPDVVVVDIAIGDDEGVTRLLADLSERRPGVTIVALAGDGSVDERVRAAHMGAQTVVETSLPPDAVVDAALLLTARRRATSTVLAVDDDPIFLVLVREILEAEGIAVESLDNAGGLWAALEAVEPDLLVLDNDMPGLDGISICRAIRSDDRWGRLPVLFLSGSRSPELVRSMFAAGADDFVPKPVSAEDLVTRVANRIERSRVSVERPGVDLATGLPSARTFLADASRLLGLAEQESRPAVLAVAELDPPSASAIAAFGRLLRQSAAAEDAVGAWPGGRVAGLLYGVTAAEAQLRLGRIVDASLVAGGDTASRPFVGLASVATGRSDMRALGGAAERALDRARQAGGGIEVDITLDQGPTDVVDVLLVDDDEALGTLVVHALTGRGWRVRWLRDGAEAVALLDRADFATRVVLLDVGLPGLDGLSVLRHLAQEGRLDTTRVVMLTVRTNEGEVLEALELGAFDHVSKPFSLSVLMHRVRRAVEG